MKKTCKKLLAVILALTMLLAIVPTMASAKSYPEIEGIQVREKKVMSVGDTYTIKKQKAATEINAIWYGYVDYVVDFCYDEEDSSEVTLEAVCEGVELVRVSNYKYDSRNEWYDLIDEYYIVVIVESEEVSVEDMGEITSLYDTYTSCNYRSGDCLYACFDSLDGEYGTYFTEYYVTYNGDIFVDEGGIIDTYSSTGNASGVYYVIDAQGNIFSADFEAEVTYTFWQHLIRIFLFGWLWY